MMCKVASKLFHESFGAVVEELQDIVSTFSIILHVDHGK